MPKYFNTSVSPVLYNDLGQTVDGYAWLEIGETPEIEKALERGELLKVDSEGNFVYPSNEESPDNASKKNTRK